MNDIQSNLSALPFLSTLPPWTEALIGLSLLVAVAALANFIVRRVILRVALRVIGWEAPMLRQIASRLANIVPAIIVARGIYLVPHLPPEVAIVTGNVVSALVILSIVPLGAARSQADFTMADMAAPRAMFDRLPAWGRRATWAHQNSFEGFTLHAPACLFALIAGTTSPAALLAAWLFPLLRLIYIGAYVGNVPPLRGLCWASALLCSGTIYMESLKAVLQG